MNRFLADRIYVIVEKPGEKYVFTYDDESRPEMLRTLGRYASNPDLSFNWYDAALVSQKIRLDQGQRSE